MYNTLRAILYGNVLRDFLNFLGYDDKYDLTLLMGTRSWLSQLLYMAPRKMLWYYFFSLGNLKAPVWDGGEWIFMVLIFVLLYRSHINKRKRYIVVNEYMSNTTNRDIVYS